MATGRSRSPGAASTPADPRAQNASTSRSSRAASPASTRATYTPAPVSRAGTAVASSATRVIGAALRSPGALRDLAVGGPGGGGGGPPGEAGGSAAAGLDQAAAQVLVAGQADQAGADGRPVERVDQQGGVAGDLGQAGAVAGQHRDAVGHGLQHRQPEPLVEAGEGEAGGGPVEGGEEGVADRAGQLDPHRVP